eukprot:1194155-Prorocentrum_minimum.AAC.2
MYNKCLLYSAGKVPSKVDRPEYELSRGGLLMHLYGAERQRVLFFVCMFLQEVHRPWPTSNIIGSKVGLRPRNECSASPGVDCLPANVSLSAGGGGNIRRIFNGCIVEMPCAEWYILVSTVSRRLSTYC